MDDLFEREGGLTQDQKDELEGACEFALGEVVDWLQKKGMFANPECPTNRRFMTDEEWKELQDVMKNSILSF